MTFNLWLEGVNGCAHKLAGLGLQLDREEQIFDQALSRGDECFVQ